MRGPRAARGSRARAPSLSRAHPGPRATVDLRLAHPLAQRLIGHPLNAPIRKHGAGEVRGLRIGWRSTKRPARDFGDGTMEARAEAKAAHGEGSVISLWSEKDATRPR